MVATVLSVQAAVNGAKAILGGPKEGPEAATKRAPSAWTDLELDRLAYEHAHLLGERRQKSWSFTLAKERGTWTAQFIAVDGHPVFGGGLLCCGVFDAYAGPPDADEQSIAGVLEDFNRLSMAESMSALGAWCAAPGTNKFAYVAFLPNVLKSARAVNYLVAEMIRKPAEAHEWVERVKRDVGST
jgi:hypothetical protein